VQKPPFKTNIMKVKVMNRSVYYKIAEVEIEIPNETENVDEYLQENEHLWVDKLDQKLSSAKHHFGFGMDKGNWNESSQESETRYECDKIGGHL